MTFNYWADRLIWGKLWPMVACPHVEQGEPQKHREVLICADGPELVEWCDRPECCYGAATMLLSVSMLHRVRTRRKELPSE